MFDIAIIGGGPAGASAALYTAKAGKKTLLIDNDKGMTRRALMKNYYGIEEIDGPTMVDTGLKQAENFGAILVKETAQNLKQNGDTFTVTTDGGNYEAKYVILTTGASVSFAEDIGIKTKDGIEPRIKKVVDVDADGRTSMEGVWAAGTCAGVSVHAIITAGDGAKVAINVISEMNGERYVDHDILES
ncbi:FAD-dependent oxidoreductase [Pueribacillus sp. YX66]|uniref:FAD-dependent oxidoreductase n=1 Tax=Pueribacillus sp. YX66 TaxID=3229242 RepID=UPI00358D5F97